ncbi:hypothetical protein [Rugosimonospora acidiphila]|uniref:hypothetical protein n=1 Tax=Rugosimonospora acidiphila TaxID=556531 RepID=UPI0031EF65A2
MGLFAILPTEYLSHAPVRTGARPPPAALMLNQPPCAFSGTAAAQAQFRHDSSVCP